MKSFVDFSVFFYLPGLNIQHHIRTFIHKKEKKVVFSIVHYIMLVNANECVYFAKTFNRKQNKILNRIELEI